MNDFSDTFHKISLIRHIPIFRKLNILDLHALASRCELVRIKKGGIILRQGGEPDAFFCLVSGRLQAFQSDPDGSKQIVDYLHRGMFFGLVSILTGEAQTLTFEAINDSLLLKMAKEDFMAFFRSIPHLGVEFSRSLSRRIKTREARSGSVFETTIISVYSPLKDAGSSTYGLNLAIALKKESHRSVVLVNMNPLVPQDSSPFETGTRAEGASPQWKRAALPLKEIMADDERIRKAIAGRLEHVDLLNVAVDPDDSTLVEEISRFVSTLACDYHYVIVDLPNEMDEVVMKTLTQSDRVHFLIGEKSSDTSSLRSVLDKLKKQEERAPDIERVQVIVRGVPAEVSLSHEAISRLLGYDILMKLPYIHPGELTKANVSEALQVSLPAGDSEYARAVKAIARQIAGSSVGLVLGGGAALGIAHIGVLRQLEEENIAVDMIVGSSMGAVIGALWAVGYSADQVAKLAGEFESRFKTLSLFDPVFPKSGIMGGRFIRRWLKKKLGGRTFYATRVPLKIVSYDLSRREELVHQGGRLIDALMESIAIPGVVQPRRNEDRLIIDGGVLNPLPTNVCASFGIKKIIAVNVMPSPQDVLRNFQRLKSIYDMESQVRFCSSPVRYLAVRLRRFARRMFLPNISDIMVRTLQATGYMIAEQNARQADILIHPDLFDIDWYEFYRVRELVERGEEATRKEMEQIKNLSREIY